MDRVDKRFEQILRETQLQIRCYIRGCGVGDADVDDVAQEVYLDFYQQMDRMPHDVEPIRWLKGMARNKVLMFYRQSSSHRKMRERLVVEYLTRDAEGENLFEAAEYTAYLRQQLRKCIDRLSERARRVLRLRHREACKTQTIADRLGMPAGTVRKMLFRIRENLRLCLRKELLEKE